MHVYVYIYRERERDIHTHTLAADISFLMCGLYYNFNNMRFIISPNNYLSAAWSAFHLKHVDSCCVSTDNSKCRLLT